MAITLSRFFALGITLLTILRSRISLEELLFGDILSTLMGDVWQIGWITIVILVAVKFLDTEILFFTFDPLGADAGGLPVTQINVGLMTLMTLAGYCGYHEGGGSHFSNGLHD